MVIAGTGHRPDKLGGYSVEVHNQLVYLAEWWLKQQDITSASKVISGMALGWDQALAIAAIRSDVPLWAAVPFEGQEARWRPEQQDRYKRILEKADVVKYVCPPGYANWKMQKRNEWMVDQLTGQVDVLLALWDGSPGGTANCIKYAQKVLKERNFRLQNLWSAWSK